MALSCGYAELLYPYSLNSHFLFCLTYLLLPTKVLPEISKYCRHSVLCAEIDLLFTNNHRPEEQLKVSERKVNDLVEESAKALAAGNMKEVRRVFTIQVHTVHVHVTR